MVKPPKTMEPSAIKDMSKAGRDQTKAFSNDSFHTYMARKIDMQRHQFGNVQLPPSPPQPPLMAVLQQRKSSPPIVKQRLQQENNEIRQKSSLQPISQQHQQQQSFPESNSYDKLAMKLPSIAGTSDSKSDDPLLSKERQKKKKTFGVEAVLKRLQRRYGILETTTDIKNDATVSTTSKKRRRNCKSDNLPKSRSEDNIRVSLDDKNIIHCNDADDKHTEMSSVEMIDEIERENVASDGGTEQQSATSTTKKRTNLVQQRPDLFFYGIVVLINGYTNPDAETLQRLLQKHGGDVERYETSRITHIIAERLSTAKANVYKKQQRNPKPVCQPNWIIDSVQAYKLLPYQNYILDDVKHDKNLRSVASIFHRQQNTLPTSTVAILNEELVDNSPVAESRVISKLSIQSPALNLKNKWESNNRGENDETAHEQTLPEMVDDDFTIESKEMMTKKEASFYDGTVRTVGTDPSFLESFFAASRLSFIGSYRQRTRPQQQSPLPMKRIVGCTNNTSMEEERFIFHVDMDCFFASVVLRKYPQFKNQPVAISHNNNLQRGKGTISSTTTEHGAKQLFKDSTSECATCNYVARKYGITKGMFLSRAKALCPDLVILPYDYEGYEEVSESVSDILDRYAMEYNGYVEHVSCDEAYMELFIHPNENGVPVVIAGDVAEAIRKEIFSLTQCTASVGVATNKFLAKLATDHVKPNKSFVMDDFQAILKSVKLGDLHGIGYRMKLRLENERLVSVQDIWDLDNGAETELCRILGPGLGKKVYGFCHGKDDRRIHESERKTIGAECNYGVRFDGPYGVDHMVEGLCKEVEKRMTNVGVKGVKITLKVKQRKSGAGAPPKFLGHGSCHNLSKSGEVRNREPTKDWKSFSEVAMEMYNELKVDKNDVRGMGIVISKLLDDDADASPNVSSSATGLRSISKWFKKNEPKKDSISSRKVDFVLPEGKSDRIIGEIDDDSINSDIICVETATATSDRFNTRYDNDIALPSLSQIHMSQVNVLPSPMRKQIIAKMETEQSKDSPEPPNDRLIPARDVRFRQTNVKRMFRLASVKAGAAAIVDESGQSISLTQLDCLPLQLQLEIANEDSNGVGTLQVSPMKKSRKEYATSRADRTIDATERPSKREKNLVVLCSENEITVDAIDSDPQRCYKPNFVNDNVIPLVAYLDKHPHADMEAMQYVSEFLCICVLENRLSDTVRLLQILKRRTDRWSTHGFDVIFETVNRQVCKCYRANLDKEWILQL